MKNVYFILLLFILSTGYSSAQEDEFESYNEVSQSDKSDDEFESYSEDEFESFEQSSSEEGTTCTNSCGNEGGCGSAEHGKNWWVIGILIFTGLTGVFVRNKKLRALRGISLLTALVVLGFYKGGCPCPIMSFQHTALFFMGEEVAFSKMLWFVGLIPITYVFGRVWCGWVCHLGAIQEFIFLPGKVKVLQTEKAQRVMRIIRIVLLVALLTQLFITHTNLYKHIDPFKVIFNLYSSNITGWVLLGLLLLSSVFIYRPFCKAVCPIGLMLGWIAKIPGASVIGLADKCTGCTSCNNSCKINAITRDQKHSVLDNQECIACGECLQNCNKNILTFFRKNKQHEDKISCKRA